MMKRILIALIVAGVMLVGATAAHAVVVPVHGGSGNVRFTNKHVRKTN